MDGVGFMGGWMGWDGLVDGWDGMDNLQARPISLPGQSPGPANLPARPGHPPPPPARLSQLPLPCPGRLKRPSTLLSSIPPSTPTLESGRARLAGRALRRGGGRDRSVARAAAVGELSCPEHCFNAGRARNSASGRAAAR
jgi:hypothetical protein